MEFDFARRPTRTHAVRQVKSWAEEALRLPDGYAVLVTELRCPEDGCPPIETVIAIIGGPEKYRQGKLPDHEPRAYPASLSFRICSSTRW
jgi:hypothetical protein